MTSRSAWNTRREEGDVVVQHRLDGLSRLLTRELEVERLRVLRVLGGGLPGFVRSDDPPEMGVERGTIVGQSFTACEI